MKLAPFAFGLVLAAALAVGHGPSAHAQSAQSAQSQSNNKVKQASAQQTFVTVNDGDTLDGIATAHSSTYMRLYDANTDISDPNMIYPDEKIRIPAADEQLADRTLPAEAAAPVAAAPTASSPVSSTPAYTPPAPVAAAPVSGCGDNQYAAFIYSHESGCRTTAMSPNGCYGIGQACPASKLAYCGADYACQNAFFTAYAGKYGGWAGAYNFWVSHGWW